MSLSIPTKAVAYVRLSKISVYQHFYPWILALILLLREGLLDSWMSRLAMAFFLVASICGLASAAAADDVVGFRDGSDAANYSGESLNRDIARKPLLSGFIREPEAVTFATTVWFVGVMVGLLGVATLNWRVPMAAVLLFIAAQAVSVQYNWGARFSARPLGGEVVMFFGQASSTILPYWVISGHLSALTVYLGVVQGIWLMTVPAYSNAGDASGDRAVGRNTFAAVAGERLVRAELLVLCAGSVGVLALVCREIGFHPIMVAIFFPFFVIQVLLVRTGVVKRNWSLARKLSFAAYDLGTISIVIVLVIFGFN